MFITTAMSSSSVPKKSISNNLEDLIQDPLTTEDRILRFVIECFNLLEQDSIDISRDQNVFRVLSKNLIPIKAACFITAISKILKPTDTTIMFRNFLFEDLSSWEALKNDLFSSTSNIKHCIFNGCNLMHSLLLYLLHDQLNWLSLSIQEQNLDRFQLQVIGNFLVSNKNLECFEIWKCSVEDDGIRRLSEGIKKNCSLKVFKLTSSNLSNESLLFLADMLSRHESLTTLSLDKNYISDLGARALGLALKDENLPHVNLSLGDNFISDRGAFDLLKFGRRLSMLNLQKNDKIKSPMLIEKGVKRKYLESLSVEDTGIAVSDLEAFRPKKKEKLFAKTYYM